MTQQKAIDHSKLRLRVQWVAAPNTPEQLILAAKSDLEVALNGIVPDFVQSDPMAILFVTGGSEKDALQAIEGKHHVLLLAFGRHNGFASAAEVQAHLSDRGIVSRLCNLSDQSTIEEVRRLIAVWSRVRGFTHKRLGIIGKPSDWLVASTPGADALRGKFGIRLRVFPWNEIGSPAGYPQSADFLDYFHAHHHEKFGEHSRIQTIIQQIIHDNQLDGIAVECFSLVKGYEMTACLSLAQLNAIGIPAACEGDLVSLSGMLFVQQLTGKIPWMANLSGIYSDHIELSHCTIAPDMLNSVEITTHFETGLGLAIKGELPQQVYTIFRWDQHFEKALITVGSSRQDPYNPLACRTQLSLTIEPDKAAKYLKDPLGNHQLVLSGDFSEILETACNYLNIAVI